MACAFDLARAGRDVVVIEAAERAGGVVGSLERDGFRFETGPNTIQASAAAFRTLCGDLGIAGRLIVSPPEQKDRFVFVHGRIRALPATPLEFLSTPILSLRSRMFVCTEAFRPWKPPGDGLEPDLSSFITERLGAEAARVLGGAFVRGVYAAELAELGAKSAMPRMWRALEEHKSLVRGMRALGQRPEVVLPGPRVPRTSLLSFPEGLQEIVHALERALKEHGARLYLRRAASRLQRTRSPGSERRRWRIDAGKGESFEADDLVLAVPAPIAVRLLTPALTSDFDLDGLRGIVHSRVTLVHLGFAQSELTEFPAGFGYLVPPPDPALRSVGGAGARPAGSEEPLVLGTIFASNLFPGRAPRGSLAVTSFYKSDDVERMNEKELISQACRDLALALRQAKPPRASLALTKRWTDVIPHYAPGHAARIAELLHRIQSDMPGLHLAGSYVAGVSVDDVIARGRAVAASILARRAEDLTADGSVRPGESAPGAAR